MSNQSIENQAISLHQSHHAELRQALIVCLVESTRRIPYFTQSFRDSESLHPAQYTALVALGIAH
jgi:hypothetical protein